jgi:hypothetical protein
MDTYDRTFGKTIYVVNFFKFLLLLDNLLFGNKR